MSLSRHQQEMLVSALDHCLRFARIYPQQRKFFEDLLTECRSQLIATEKKDEQNTQNGS